MLDELHLLTVVRRDRLVTPMADVKHFDVDGVLAKAELTFWSRGWASTGVAELVKQTGLSKSSLYSTFGGKGSLYEAALGRYVARRSRSSFARLHEPSADLESVAVFFDTLVRSRCEGDFARWGCFVTNAQVEPGVPAGTSDLIVRHNRMLREGLRHALLRAHAQGQLREDAAVDQYVDMFALLAYAVNVRSRAGESSNALGAAVAGALHAVGS
ncbi:TetR/AcrR family transcriptional regulator [Flexivirga sp. ID2601S]|uniref:TetR/AcrR family transcriptional regulator n=1 Tax=Flexivirga aerilata TaxID=1656889 RepID=A0A849AIW3_9MICO|nr:TetR family transcriptional regulator [Flexivirga aerilata]NNG40764.1 TetR/AcrR family transcriptional regulator [Flexivirga aerilata]